MLGVDEVHFDEDPQQLLAPGPALPDAGKTFPRLGLPAGSHQGSGNLGVDSVLVLLRRGSFFLKIEQPQMCRWGASHGADVCHPLDQSEGHVLQLALGVGDRFEAGQAINLEEDRRDPSQMRPLLESGQIHRAHHHRGPFLDAPFLPESVCDREVLLEHSQTVLQHRIIGNVQSAAAPGTPLTGGAEIWDRGRGRRRRLAGTITGGQGTDQAEEQRPPFGSGKISGRALPDISQTVLGHVFARAGVFPERRPEQQPLDHCRNIALPRRVSGSKLKHRVRGPKLPFRPTCLASDLKPLPCNRTRRGGIKRGEHPHPVEGFLRTRVDQGLGRRSEQPTKRGAPPRPPSIVQRIREGIHPARPFFTSESRPFEPPGFEGGNHTASRLGNPPREPFKPIHEVGELLVREFRPVRIGERPVCQQLRAGGPGPHGAQ